MMRVSGGAEVVGCGGSFEELCEDGCVMNPISRSQPHHQAGH